MTLATIVRTPLLIYGIGNVGRQDDGLGPQLVERLLESGVPDGVTLDSGYQLSPEDAALLTGHSVVIFVDATIGKDAAAPYSLCPVYPASEVSFTTHAMSPGALLTLCRRLWGMAPEAYALALPAYAFEINAALSPGAEANLAGALRDVKAALTALDTP